jgi:hypothetical protein
MAAWKGRESDPAVIDSIGIHETITLANERFATVAGDYASFWASETEGHSDVFARWADALGLSVGREVADLWEKDEWHTAWFGRACREKIAQGLESLIKQWKERAAALEIQHLENPHLSMHSLLTAEGDVKLAFTLDSGKRALESARGAISGLQANLADVTLQSQGPSLGNQPEAKAEGVPPAQPGEPFKEDDSPATASGSTETARRARLAVAERQGGLNPGNPLNNPVDRRATVDAFILKCNQETSMKVTRKHIWRAAGHKAARQLQFWQVSDPKATTQDDQNFRRILAMSPDAFVDLLHKKGII